LPAEVWRGNEVAPTLNVFDNTGESRATVVIAEPILIDGTRVDDVRIYQSPVQTLAARMGTGGNNVPMVATDATAIPIDDVREVEKHQNGTGIGNIGDPAYTLDTISAAGVAYGTELDKPIGFSHTQGLDAQPSEIAFPTLRVGGAGHAVAYTSSSFASYQEGVGTLRANGGDLGGGSESLIVEPDIAPTFKTLDMVVRRLTPIECERLMGWPDNHTLHRADGKENSDTTRYKMCGNGVASPVAQWIAEHILNVDRTF
jgi:DNA (cytosine-5)-methyltransferase 1